jgi:hypothetical protein
VAAALGRRQGVDLVDDDGVDADQALARPRAEDQVQRLRGRDQHVARIAALAVALLGRGVTGADIDAHRLQGHPVAGGDPAQADQRRPQAALDVVGQRLERRHVDDLDPGALAARLAAQAIEAPQEGGQGLAAAGRRQHEGVVAAGDRRPAAGLDPGRRREALAEPIPRDRTEPRQRIHRATIVPKIGSGDTRRDPESRPRIGVTRRHHRASQPVGTGTASAIG